MKAGRSSSIRHPPIIPDKNIKILFDMLEKYQLDIENAYRSLLEQKRHDTKTLLSQLNRLHEKTSILVSVLNMLIIHLTFQTPVLIGKDTPRKIEQEFYKLSEFVMGLDRGLYRGFFKKALSRAKNMLQEVIYLNIEIATKMNELQQPFITIVQQQQPQQQLLAPPPLTRNVAQRTDWNRL